MVVNQTIVSSNSHCSRHTVHSSLRLYANSHAEARPGQGTLLEHVAEPMLKLTVLQVLLLKVLHGVALPKSRC